MIETLFPDAWSFMVRDADADIFWIVSGLLALAVLGSFYGIFHFHRRYYLLEDTPTSKIRSAAQGYVELDGIGYLLKGTPIVSPLSGIACTWYSYKVEEKSGFEATSSERWKTIISKTSDGLFLLQDDTGDCIVDPEGADVTPAITETWFGPTPMWNPRTRRARSGNFRYTEKRMHAGDPLYAIGQFRTVGSAQELPDTKEEVRQLLAGWKRDQAGLHARFDSNRDGMISLEEWKTARKAAQQEVMRDQAQRFHQASQHLLGKPDDPKRAFILSVLPQGMLVRRYKRYAMLCLLGFLLAGSTLTWLLTTRLTGG